jgi:hypothetical protein
MLNFLFYEIKKPEKLIINTASGSVTGEKGVDYCFLGRPILENRPERMSVWWVLERALSVIKWVIRSVSDTLHT